MNFNLKQFAYTYFSSVGVSVILLLVSASIFGKTDTLITPDFIYPMLISVLVSNIVMRFSYRTGASVAETWTRRVICIGLLAIITPTIFVLAGTLDAEKSVLKYFIVSVITIQLLAFVIYLIADRATTKATLDKINEVLKNNR